MAMDIDTHLWYATIQTLIPIMGQVLNANVDYMEVWCIPSAAHVPWVDRSQNKVLGIRLLSLLFVETSYILSALLKMMEIDIEV